MMDTVLSWLSMAATYLVANILPAAIIAVVGILLIHLVMNLISKLLEKSKLEQVAHGLIKTVIKVVLYALLALIIASKIGIDVTGIVALASVLTLAVSLAVQTALTNLIGGFTLLYTKPFTAGDFVEIAGQSGTVDSIGLTYTKLSTVDNKVVSIPNSAVVATQIVNYTVSGTRRVDVSVCASYDMNPDEVIAALQEAGRIPTALETPAPFAAVKAFGESTVEYVLQVWCKSEDYWTTLFEANKNVKAVFAAKNVKMSFPHLNIHVDK